MQNNNLLKIDLLKRQSIQSWRRVVQWGFVLLILWIGIDFYLFVHNLEQGIVTARPPGVGAFLPISALISLKYWLLTGFYNTIHPAALALLLTFMLMAMLLKKGFCSWICPFGLLSEYLTRLHIKIFDRQLKLPRWMDYPLRSLKYLLLLFFLWAIFIDMNESALHKFIYSPYNRTADIKMLYFFTRMSELTFWVLAILVAISLGIPYFWCRYLCPYGALLGALSWLSPIKIQRRQASCIDCVKCTRVCPSHIKVHTANRVFSDECHACLQCVDVCPVKDTLYLSNRSNKFKLPRRFYASGIVLLFLLGVLIALLTGRWHNSISGDEYLYHINHINDAEYFHSRGEVADYDTEKWQPEAFSKEE
jgi:polyferredoxin